MKERCKILVVDDEASARESLALLLESQGYLVKTADSAGQALEELEKEYFPLVVTDIMMPKTDGIAFLRQIKETYRQTIEVIMVTGYGTVETAVQTMKLGAFGYYIKGNHPEELLLEIKKAGQLVELKAGKAQHDGEKEINSFVFSRNARMKEVWEWVKDVADTNANVLITGETGVGKEIVANKIHSLSRRRDGLFLPVNCQNYPDNLIESELFGYEKGAFTGASARRIGKIEEAGGGTLFLDEIGEMGLPTQIMLLRALESRRITRLGSNQAIPVDFRLVSATNRDLQKEVAAGRFREDFFYRINTIEIRVPPLRERREDLEDLIPFFLSRYEKETGKTIREIDRRTQEYLYHYEYPGNIRELKNMIERMVILSKDGILRLGGQGAGPEAGKRQSVKPYRQARQEFEKEYLQHALSEHRNHISDTAKAIGLSRRQLFNKITEYGIVTEKQDTRGKKKNNPKKDPAEASEQPGT